MPSVSEKHVLELQRILKEKYGRDLSYADVSKMASDLVGYFDLLAKLKWEMDHDEDAKKSVLILRGKTRN